MRNYMYTLLFLACALFVGCDAGNDMVGPIDDDTPPDTSDLKQPGSVPSLNIANATFLEEGVWDTRRPITVHVISDVSPGEIEEFVLERNVNGRGNPGITIVELSHVQGEAYEATFVPTVADRVLQVRLVTKETEEFLSSKVARDLLLPVDQGALLVGKTLDEHGEVTRLMRRTLDGSKSYEIARFKGAIQYFYPLDDEGLWYRVDTDDKQIPENNQLCDVYYDGTEVNCFQSDIIVPRPYRGDTLVYMRRINGIDQTFWGVPNEWEEQLSWDGQITTGGEVSTGAFFPVVHRGLIYTTVSLPGGPLGVLDPISKELDVRIMIEEGVICNPFDAGGEERDALSLNCFRPGTGEFGFGMIYDFQTGVFQKLPVGIKDIRFLKGGGGRFVATHTFTATPSLWDRDGNKLAEYTRSTGIAHIEFPDLLNN